jgi:hypothetical protein
MRQDTQYSLLKEQGKVEAAPTVAGMGSERVVDASTRGGGRLCHGFDAGAGLSVEITLL